MKERERWIVYPLLFLSLGAALRDKIFQRTRNEQVICESLLVVDSRGRVQASLVGDQLQLGAKPGTGRLRVGAIETAQLNRAPQAAAQSAVFPDLPSLLAALRGAGININPQSAPAVGGGGPSQGAQPAKNGAPVRTLPAPAP